MMNSSFTDASVNGLPAQTAGQSFQPRIRSPHNRHHFAYANIHRWMTAGDDVTALLPYLLMACMLVFRPQGLAGAKA